MAIARQGSATVAANTSHTSTPSYTVNAASNLVVVVIANPNTGGQVTGITYGGTSMTIKAFEDTTDATWITLGYLLNPATGANNFAVSGLTAGSMNVFAADYSGIGAADGGFVTNNASTASVTSNVSLTNTNEWVMCGAICGHLTNVFQTTANLTIEQQNQAFLSSGFYDSNAGFGSGTVGFVTTITGSSPRQWVVLQAFTAASAGTTITADFSTPFESLAQLDQDSFGLSEAAASLQIDSAPQSEWGMALTTNSSTPLESLSSFIMNSDDQIEFLLRINSNSQVFQDILATQIVRNSVDTESLSANSLSIEAPIEIKSSLIQIVSNESTPIETTSNLSINTIFPIEVISTNKLVLSNTTTAVESLGSITENTSHQDDWLSSQVSQFSGTGEWLLAVKLNNSILAAWQSALLHNSIVQVEFVGSVVSDTSAPLEYVGTTKLIVGNSTLPVEFTISLSGGQSALDELTQIFSYIIPVEDEFAGTPITILLSSIGRLARSVKIRLSRPTTKVRLLGPKVRSPR